MTRLKAQFQRSGRDSFVADIPKGPDFLESFLGYHIEIFAEVFFDELDSDRFINQLLSYNWYWLDQVDVVPRDRDINASRRTLTFFHLNLIHLTEDFHGLLFVLLLNLVFLVRKGVN